MKLIQLHEFINFEDCRDEKKSKYRVDIYSFLLNDTAVVLVYVP